VCMFLAVVFFSLIGFFFIGLPFFLILWIGCIVGAYNTANEKNQIVE
jgi:cbb3-type cytochrome oxidase subunit 3